MPNIPDELLERSQSSLRMMQIVSLGMVMGQVLFLAAILAAINTDDLHNELKMLIFLAAATGIVNYILSFLIGPVFRKSINASDPPNFEEIKTVTGGLMTSHLIQSALITGGAYLNLVVFLLDKGMISLIVAGMGAGLILLLFPTRGRYARAIEKRLTI